MSGPAGSPDELDQALALANDAPTQAPSGGTCADCPARGGPAGVGPTTNGPGAGARLHGAGGPGSAGPRGHDTAPADDDLAAPWLSAASPSTEGLRGPAAADRPPAPDADDLAPEWLLGSPDRDADAAPGEGRLSGGMRALRRPASGESGADGGIPADDGLLPEWLTRAARRVGLNRPDAPEAGDETDPDDALAAPWVPRLRTRPSGPGPAHGPQAQDGRQRADDDPAPAAGATAPDTPVAGEPEEPAASTPDGMRGAARAARRAGDDAFAPSAPAAEPPPGGAASDQDPARAERAAVPPGAERGPRDGALGVGRESGPLSAVGGPVAGSAAGEPDDSAVSGSAGRGPALGSGGAGDRHVREGSPPPAAAAQAPGSAAREPGPAGAVDRTSAVAAPAHSPGPGAASGDPGRAGAGESFPPSVGIGSAGGHAAGAPGPVGRADRRPSAGGGVCGGLAGPGPVSGPGGAASGVPGGAGAGPGSSPSRSGAGPQAERACSHACGGEVREGGPAAAGGPSGFGGPGRGGPPVERHDGQVTSHRAAAGAGPGTPVDVSEASASPGRPGRETTRPAEPPRAHVTWDEAQRIAARAAAPAAPVTVPLERAARQVLAAPVEALADLPSFDTAAMDGWAVAGPGPWVPAGPPGGTGVLAGHAMPEPLADGCAVRIATGARMPDGATAVLRSERAELRDGRLRPASGAPAHSDAHGTDVRPRGQECRTGDRLLPAGTPVTPPVLGLAAAAGYDRLTVTPRPRAEVLVLGDELLHVGLPSEGRIRDALGPMVGPWLAALGAEVLVTRRLGDDAEALHEAVTTTTADLVVTTGGTAHGPVDHVRPTLHRIGARLLVDGVEVRPGHPMLLAALAGQQQGRHLVGLPGNPLAAVSGLLTLAAPLLRARAGLPEPEPVRATLTADVQGHPRDTRLVPVTRSADGSGATPLRWTGPAMLRGIAGASALAAVPPGGAAAGTSVRLLELPW